MPQKQKPDTRQRKAARVQKIKNNARILQQRRENLQALETLAELVFTTLPEYPDYELR